MARTLIVTALVAIIMAGFVLAYTALRPAQGQPPMGGMTTTPPMGGMTTTPPMGGMTTTPQASGMGGIAEMDPTVPPVKGYTEGQEIRFIHTEASDPNVAEMLTRMMRSPVLVVPSLAQAPEVMRARVYVFTNGIKGDGPFGFQPDVFDSPPGTDGYRPLRAVHLVTWRNEQSARELRSEAEVKAAEAGREVTIERPGVVVNMPLLTWPGGRR